MPWDPRKDTRLLESSVSAFSLCIQTYSSLCRIGWSNLRSLIRDALSSIPYLISSDHPSRCTLSYSTLVPYIRCIPSPTPSGISWKSTLLVCSAQFEAKDSLSIVRAPRLMTTRIYLHRRRLSFMYKWMTRCSDPSITGDPVPFLNSADVLSAGRSRGKTEDTENGTGHIRVTKNPSTSPRWDPNPVVDKVCVLNGGV